MNRSLRLLVGPVACALALSMAAGCSSSGGAAFPVTPIDPTATTVPASQLLGKPLKVQGCSLATSAQAKALLGGSATAQELPSRPIYRACSWTGSGSRHFSLAVIRLGNGQVGFTFSKIQGLTSSVVAGLGSRAVYLNGQADGINAVVLAADQGSVSVSLSVSWKGTLPNSDSLKENLTTLIRSVFAQLGS